MPYAILFFANASDAREYRKARGTGGFIFASDDAELVALFPYQFTPSLILCHAVTRGKDGSLIA